MLHLAVRFTWDTDACLVFNLEVNVLKYLKTGLLICVKTTTILLRKKYVVFDITCNYVKKKVIT